MRFYEKNPEKRRRTLGDRMLDGANRRRATAPSGGRVWVGKVVVFAAAGSAVGLVLGALIGRIAGSPEIGMGVGCALGALAGTFLGEGNAVEALLAGVLGGALALGDSYLFEWAQVPFYQVAKMSALGPAGVIVGVVLGRVLTKGHEVLPDAGEKE